MEKAIKKAMGLVVLAVMLVCVGVLSDGSKMSVEAVYFGYASQVEQTDMTANSISIKWKGDNEAVKYKIEYERQYITEKKVVEYTTSCTYVINGLKKGSMYSIGVTPINNKGEEGTVGSVSGATTNPSELSGIGIDKYWHSLSEFTLGWNKPVYPTPSGNELYIYNAKNKLVYKDDIYGGFSSVSLKYKNGQIYNYKIRAYITLNGQNYYSNYTTFKWISPVTVKRTKIYLGKLNVKWQKVAGATGYDIYVSSSNKKGYKKVKSVGGKTTSIKISKFKKKKINKKKIYYVYVVAKQKVGNKTYKSGKVSYWSTKGSIKAYF